MIRKYVNHLISANVPLNHILTPSSSIQQQHYISCFLKMPLYNLKAIFDLIIYMQRLNVCTSVYLPYSHNHIFLKILYDGSLLLGFKNIQKIHVFYDRNQE